MRSLIKPRRAPWRMLAIGSTCWAPFGSCGWRPGIITGLGKNRGDNTVVHLKFETGGRGRRLAGELWWRRPELKGKDKPPRPYESLPEGYRKRIESERIELETKDKPKVEAVSA